MFQDTPIECEPRCAATSTDGALEYSCMQLLDDAPIIRQTYVAHETNSSHDILPENAECDGNREF